jgi:hypothetical protein
MSLGLYVLIGFISSVIYFHSLEISAQSAILDVLILVALTYLALWLRRKQERLTQTITALAGCGVLLGIITLPLLALNQISSEGIEIIALLILCVSIWQIVVFSHILKHALSIPYALAVILTIIYLVILIFTMGILTGMQE